MVKLAQRQMLHAAELSLRHPGRDEVVSFQAPVPKDLIDVLNLLRAEPG
jgi:23S rRNA pseudouridine1911/1915/1917 synthase